jgi:hypothetical protein
MAFFRRKRRCPHIINAMWIKESIYDGTGRRISKKKKGRELEEVDETDVLHAFYPLADSARRT